MCIRDSNLTGSYAMALVLFTLVIKVVLFPLSIKGKRSMMKMTSLQGKMKQLEKQFPHLRTKVLGAMQRANLDGWGDTTS